MIKEKVILLLAWSLTVIMLLIFVPRKKFREAQVIFLFKQFITWLFGLIAVESKLIEYPVRIFTIATRASFTFEYFVYPAISVIFCLYYPSKVKRFKVFLYYAGFCSAITIIEVLLEKFTVLINYLNWNWFHTWISLFITFFLSRCYYVWFFRLKAPKP